jgi:RNA polymerase sigma-70 factor, ECF subfamily
MIGWTFPEEYSFRGPPPGPPRMTDERRARELVERAKTGDGAAFDELVALHRRRIEGLIRARLGARLEHEVEGDDVLQETVLKALESIGRFSWQGEDSFMRWIGTIAENVIRSAARKEKRRQEIPLAGDFPGADPSQSRVVRRDERFERFQEAFDALDPDARQVIHLARIQGMPIKEVARAIGRTPNATSILLYRALIKLRDRFGDTESFGLPPLRDLKEEKGDGAG